MTITEIKDPAYLQFSFILILTLEVNVLILISSVSSISNLHLRFWNLSVPRISSFLDKFWNANFYSVI